MIEAQIKQKELVNKSNISHLLNTKLAKATKVELKAEQDKLVKLQTFDLSYFLGIILFGDHSFQNLFVYEPALDTLQLKKQKGTDYILSWKSKRLYPSKLKLLYSDFLHSIKLSTILVIIF